MLEYLSSLTYSFMSNHKQEVLNSFKFSKNLSSQDIQSRIRIVVLDIIHQILSTGQLEISFLSTVKSCEYDSQFNVNRVLMNKQKVLRLPKSSKSIAHILKILQISEALLQSSTKATKREVFYMCPDLFISQKNSDKAIEYASAYLEIPRNRLNILSSGKGLISGHIEYSESGNFTQIGNRLVKVPIDIDEVSDLQVNCDFILIVEKETVLNRLVQEKFFEEHKCVGITGCGYPDMQTREFIRRVIDEFSWVPVFIFTDFDPHGFKILCTYTFGSAKMSAECDSLALPFAHWIGAHCRESFNPLPVTQKDWKMVQKFLQLPQLNSPPDNYQNRRFGLWKMQMQEMANSKEKFEIESIAEGKLSEYLGYKINNGIWI